MRRMFWIAGVILALNLHAASDQGAAVKPTGGTLSNTGANAVSANSDFLITPDDLLEIVVFDVPQMSRPYRVSPSGFIVFPLLPKPIEAAGMTPVQLSEAIATELRSAGILSNPQVNVEVKESRLHSVAVTGAVKKPQIYQVFGRTTLLDVLSQAEGLAPEAGNTVIITRGEIALRRLLLQPSAGGEQTADPRASDHGRGPEGSDGNR